MKYNMCQSSESLFLFVFSSVLSHLHWENLSADIIEKIIWLVKRFLSEKVRFKTEKEKNQEEGCKGAANR